ASRAKEFAFLRVGLHTPTTSASRTPWKPCRWNRALNPLPMNPTPRRAGAEERLLTLIYCHSRVHEVVADTELVECLLRAPVPHGNEGMTHVLQVFPAHLAGKERGSGHVSHAGKELHSDFHSLGCAIRPGDVVKDCAPLIVRCINERGAVAARALGIEPSNAVTDGLTSALVREIVCQHEVHELG